MQKLFSLATQKNSRHTKAKRRKRRKFLKWIEQVFNLMKVFQSLRSIASLITTSLFQLLLAAAEASTFHRSAYLSHKVQS